MRHRDEGRHATGLLTAPSPSGYKQFAGRSWPPQPIAAAARPRQTSNQTTYVPMLCRPAHPSPSAAKKPTGANWRGSPDRAAESCQRRNLASRRASRAFVSPSWMTVANCPVICLSPSSSFFSSPTRTSVSWRLKDRTSNASGSRDGVASLMPLRRSDGDEGHLPKVGQRMVSVILVEHTSHFRQSLRSASTSPRLATMLS
jgi:hypothetical protein